MQQIKEALKRVPLAVYAWKRCLGAANGLRQGDFYAILSSLGLLQLYGRVRKPSVPADLYTEEYYVGQGGCEGAEEFNDHQGRQLPGRLASVLAEISDIDGHAFLDLGCGRGEILLHLEQTASRVVGVDYSAAAVEISRSTVSKSEVVQANVVQFLPQFQSEPFDGILMIDITEHLFDWELGIVFKHVDRLLKPKCRLYIDTPLIPDSPYSEMHVNVKQAATEYLRFLPGFTIERKILTDPRGSNYLIILRKTGFETQLETQL